MNRTVERYKAEYPNLWRVVEELAKFEDPYKATSMLLDIVAGKEVKNER